jgi:two-component system sensor histidine kinase DegS
MSGDDFDLTPDGSQEQEGDNRIDELKELLQVEQQRVAAELRDVANKIDQSRGEVERLEQRNAAIAAEIKMMERNLDSVPRLNIKSLYETAQEVQQRLFSMRGQLERFQGEEELLRRQQVTDERINQGVEAVEASLSGGTRPSAQALIVRVIDTQESERERLSRQMHDGPAQSLTNFILQAEICQTLLDRNPERARRELETLKEAASAAFQRVRDFIFDLRPMMLTDLGLRPTIKRYLDAFQEQTDIETEFHFIGDDTRRMQPHREALIFRGLQELLGNARDHAQATRVVVTLEINDERVRVVVEDNGRGFGTGELKLDTDSSKAMGLGTLHNRISLVEGQMRIRDSETGPGARVELVVPAGPRPDFEEVAPGKHEESD